MMASQSNSQVIGAQPRIPLELQAVFVASNQGQEVYEPPASASRVFARPLRWLAYPRNRRLKNKKNRQERKLRQQKMQQLRLDKENRATTPPSASSAATPPTPLTSSSSPSWPSNDLQGLVIPVHASNSYESQGRYNNEANLELAPAPTMMTLQSQSSFTKVAKKPGHRLRRLFQRRSTASVHSCRSDLSETEHLDFADLDQQQRQQSGLSSLSSSPPAVKSSVSPQDYVDALIYARGYSTVRYATLDSAYYNRPTALQQASFRTHLLDLVRRGNASALKSHLECGLSTNPSNAFGDSLAHTICRVGRSRLLQILVDVGGTQAVRVADDNGCTPLHKACASNSLECFELLVECDLRLLYMADCRNLLPLQYVPATAWSEWIQLLQVKQDDFWPEQQQQSPNAGGGAGRFGQGQQEPPPLYTLQAPHSRPLPDPSNALPLEVAAKVASGEISPAEAQDEAKRVVERNKKRYNDLDDRSLMESMAQLPLPRELLANMLNSSDDYSDDSDLTDDSDNEDDDYDDESNVGPDVPNVGNDLLHDLDDHHDQHQDNEDDRLRESSASPVITHDNYRPRSDAAATDHSVDLAAIERAMGVLGISSRARAVQHC